MFRMPSRSTTNCVVCPFVVLIMAGCTETNTNGSTSHTGPAIPALADSLANDLVRVDGGTFIMGNAQPDRPDEAVVASRLVPHEVQLSPYSISRYEITQRQWLAVMGTNPSRHNNGCHDCPVDGISWDDAQSFIQRLNQHSKRRFRIPTEAEWEFAALGGSASKGFKFIGSNVATEVAWLGENSGHTTHEVGRLRANELGLFDMGGNVEEWCSDWYADTYSPDVVHNPVGPQTGEFHVCRGGCFHYSDYGSKACMRTLGEPYNVDEGQTGLRLASSE